MKKIFAGFSMLLLILIATGCGTSKTVGNLEYMEQIMTSRGDILQFKDSEGYKINYFVDSRDSFSLTKGAKYDVEISVEDPLNRGDFIVKVKERENKIK
ncbi:hypothetical protein [Paenibacillus xylanexedens]|uniref:hypothetical protein n=1 Tax=Paenibacillus xylanexedens TaxID=528191 RepID=UPI000F541047|nr:hypothetical protein [Paenibacillus xylanexedens]RPK31797.1 hypothetical protein EDO6_02424 [Paenibacillus xylanexedens]